MRVCYKFQFKINQYNIVICKEECLYFINGREKVDGGILCVKYTRHKLDGIQQN